MRVSPLIAIVALVACSSEAAAPSTASEATNETQPPVSVEDGCDSPPPATWEIDGTMHTVVMSQEPVAVTITSDLARVCPGGSTTFTVTFDNEGEVPVALAAPKLILSGGAQKWTLATIDDLRISAGESVTVSALATVPLVAPGQYEVFVYGFTPGGVVGVAEPEGAQPAFDQTGGCNEATFWAANDGGTIALHIRTTVPMDRARTVEVDLARPGETLVELQRGTSLGQSLCGDVIDETYQLTSSVRAVSGTATFSFGSGRSLCADGGYDGTAELSDVTFSDGTHLDSLVVTSTTIGCVV